MVAMSPEARPKIFLLTLLALMLIGATLRVYPSVITTNEQGIDFLDAESLLFSFVF